jgi:hypothetical protein
MLFNKISNFIVLGNEGCKCGCRFLEDHGRDLTSTVKISILCVQIVVLACQIFIFSLYNDPRS